MRIVILVRFLMGLPAPATQADQGQWYSAIKKGGVGGGADADVVYDGQPLLPIDVESGSVIL